MPNNKEFIQEYISKCDTIIDDFNNGSTKSETEAASLINLIFNLFYSEIPSINSQYNSYSLKKRLNKSFSNINELTLLREKLRYYLAQQDNTSKSQSNSNNISGSSNNSNIQVNGDGNTIYYAQPEDKFMKNLKEQLHSLNIEDKDVKDKLSSILDQVELDKKAKKPIQDHITNFINTAGQWSNIAMPIVTKLIELSK